MGIATLCSIAWWQRGYSNTDIEDRLGLVFFVGIHWFIFAMFGAINSCNSPHFRFLFLVAFLSLTSRLCLSSPSSLSLLSLSLSLFLSLSLSLFLSVVPLLNLSPLPASSAMSETLRR